ncbi:MAG: DUF4062 domain-containing protein [Saprospiraceae bacterium]
MNRIKVFISSVQNEFIVERKTICDYLRNDPLLGEYFDPFIFEEVPASESSPAKIYLNPTWQIGDITY